jgi:hypothetical protein
VGKQQDSKDGQAQPALIPEAAKRALEEAEERRRRQEATPPSHKGPEEIGGRGGPEPTRYGDWEKKGIASDF